MKFYKWIQKQANRQDRVGHLAGDMLPDIAQFKHCVREEDVLAEMVKICRAEKSWGPDLAAEEALTAAWREYRAEFPESARKGARTPISVSKRFAIMKRDRFKCCLCGASAGDGAVLEIDHKIPIFSGGTDDNGNLWTLCFPCNRGKSADSLDTYA